MIALFISLLNRNFFLPILLLSYAHTGFASSYELLDDRGVRVSFASPPTRIVSTLPSLTEAVCAMGHCGNLVGVDANSNYPSTVNSIKKIGGGLTPNIELIVSLKPDLVLMSKNERVSQRLEQLGLKVFVLESSRHKDVLRTLQKLDAIFKTNDSQRVWLSLENEISKAAQSVPESSKNMRVYFEVSTGPYAAGPNSFIGETLIRLGVDNIVPANLGDFPKLNPEFVVKADPDLMIISDNNLVDLLKRPGWQELTAIRTNRVCSLTKEQSDTVVRPGTRMGEGASIIAQCIISKGVHH